MRRGLSIGFFGRFGRSPALREFDTALRSVDLHPNLVPEAVKLTAVRMLQDHTGREEPGVYASRAAAEIIGYCMIGAEAFAGANSSGLAEDVEGRIEAALDQSASLDARLVLLTLHARVIQPSVVDYFGLEVISD
jgi:hypothetical protein